MFKVIIGGAIGGIIACIWGFISWGILPWHEMTINQFSDQERVLEVIKENAVVDGVYIAPSEQFIPSKADRSQMGQGCKSEGTKVRPFIYAQIKTGKTHCLSPSYYLCSFLIQCVGTILIILLLMRMATTNYGGRLLFVTVIGLIVGVLGLLPNWNWFGAGCRFTLVMMIDCLIQWFLVGLFLARFIRPNGKVAPTK